MRREITPRRRRRIERRRQVESDYAIKSEKLHIIHKLLQAHVLYEKEVDYLVQEGQVMAFPHDGFWQPMDTFSEYTLLNNMWADAKAPWKIW